MSAQRNVLVLVAIAAAAALLPATAVIGGGQAVRRDVSAADLKRVAAVTRPATDFSAPEAFELMQGGGGTSQKLVNRDSFSHAAANQSFEGRERFSLGNGFFTKFWVSSPSSTEASDGLGPLFNARSCQSCHLKDGRGHPPAAGEPAVSMFLRLSVPPRTPAERQAIADRTLPRIPEPTYGAQLQTFAVPGLKAEGAVRIDYRDVPVTLSDGTVASLRHPRYSVERPAYGPLDAETILSPRVAPPMIGLGLIEEIPAEDILAHADPDDRDGDGISGKANMVRDPPRDGLALGRFGWKANTPSLRNQAADAFSGDIGISTPLFAPHYGDCTQAQTACRNAPSGIQARRGPEEAPDPVLDLVTFYSKNLAVPARRDVADPDVLKGKGLFYAQGCASCHIPKFVTSRAAPDKPQRFQLIWPYSDFLLHDMGEGLADGAANGEATGTEWRTPPLWGIGLTQAVSGHTLFLHDGRARSLEEAILWHGGEAETSRNGFAGLAKADRDALIAFLESL